MASYSYKDHIQVANGFLAKADGKDKLTALIQYACMFLCANEPGQIKKIQTSVTAARKVFRICRPFEVLQPLLLQPGFNSKQPLALEAINKAKALFLCTYFAADHVSWAHNIGLFDNKALGEKAGRVSLWAWLLGSLCQVAAEAYSISLLSLQRKEGESDDDYNRRVEEARKDVNKRLFVLLHGIVQALLAAGLLQTLKLKPRSVGFLGVLSSAMNCYLLLPPFPKLAKDKSA